MSYRAGWCLCVFICYVFQTTEAIVFSWENNFSKTQQEAEMKNVGRVLYSPLQIFGGSCILIDDQWVLTSKHGTDKWSAAMLKVSFPALLEEGQDALSVKEIYLHPTVDVALLKLETKVENAHVIRLIEDKGFDARKGLKAWIGGYGMTGSIGGVKAGGEYHAGHNRSDGINGSDKITISMSRPEDGDAEKDEAILALFDSGSPLFLKTKKGWVLAGIASTATSGQNPDYGDQGHYARLFPILDWMKGKTRS